MNHNAFKTNREGYSWARVLSAGGMSALLLFGQTAPLLGNPTGGTVVAGSATIGPAGQTLSINQSTQNAIINWQQFSIASGETTKFIVPNNGATLNRVTGGNVSSIYGNLQSNGTLFLVNPSGIVVGPSGRIDTASFLASTLDISNQQFLAGGDLHFVGSSDASIENNGVIHGSTGDVYLIASQVNNKGAIEAPQGTAGLAAGTDVLFQQAGSEHLFVQPTPAGTKRALGVTNSGTIRAAAAELKAAGGNAYALAINNTGVIAATGYKKVGGKVYLTSEGGSISNSGKISAKLANGNGGQVAITATALASSATPSGTVTDSGSIDASATVAGGQGGTVTIKAMTGTTDFLGSILAKGGQGGAGGSVEVSGGTLHFGGTVDLTAKGGTTGTLLLDPTTLEVVTGGTGSISSGQNDANSTTIDPGTIASALAGANVVLSATNNITITNGIAWSAGTRLTLTTTGEGSTITINAPISGVNGGLTVSGAGGGSGITDTAALNVSSFILTGGTWIQNSATLPSFTASHDFELQGSSTFLRTTGVADNGAYEIADVYGLQGLGSPSGQLLGVHAELVNTVDASGTSSWNSGTGFIPIGNTSTPFTGTFDGQNFTVNNLFIDTGLVAAGLFGQINAATVENVGVLQARVVGTSYTGALVGFSQDGSTIYHSYSTGTVSGTSWAGGLLGYNSDSVVTSCQSSANVTSAFVAAGLVGENDPVGLGSAATTIVEFSSSSGSANGTQFAGGLVGGNLGTIHDSFSSASATSATGYAGGLSATIEAGTLVNDYASGVVTGAHPGGLVGEPPVGTATNSFWDIETSGVSVGFSSGNIAGTTGATTAQLMMASFYPNYDFVNVWTTNGDTTTPQLRNLPITGAAPPVTPPPPAPDPAPIIAVVQPILPQFEPHPVPPLIPTTPVLPENAAPPVSLAGDSGQVGSGDAAEMGSGGALNNVHNAHATGALNQALGAGVFNNLNDALKAFGGWTDVPGAAAAKAKRTASNAGGETILNGGDVAEVTISSVKSIPRDKVPKQLQVAMDGNVFSGATGQ